jgi:hypothetical protein
MPKWFKSWSEEIYEKKQPQWFKTWSEQVYEKNQRKQDEFNKKVETKLDSVKNELTNIIKLNKLKH